MSKQRARRVSEEIKKEVATILRDEVKDPEVGFVTITGVQLSNDLSDAKIFYSVMGDQDAVERSKAALDRALGFIRRALGQRIQLRHVPEIQFRHDRSIEEGAHIDALLEQIKEERGGE